jgi:hypothetical protein
MRVLCSLIAALIALWPLALHAQALPALTITLYDSQGQPITAATVRLTDRSGQQELGQASTDATGVAVIDAPALDQVRLQVGGVLPSGLPLRLPPTDAQGFLLFLDAGPTQVDLLADATGELALNPQTMWIQEGSTAPIPAAPTPASGTVPDLFAPAAPAPSETTPDLFAPAAPAPSVGQPVAPSVRRRGTSWVVGVLISVALSAAGFALWRLGRAS